MREVRGESGHVYRLAGEPRHGGQAMVYRAAGPGGALVAVKLGRDSGENSARLAREVAELKKLQADYPEVAPYLTGILDQGRDEHGCVFLVMPWFNRSLSDWLVGRALLDRLEAAEKASEAVVRLHRSEVNWRAGVVHRDIKPQNFLVDDGDALRVLLADFGGARRSSTDRSRSIGTGLHTFGYAPPEQMLPRRADPDRSWDTYALGVTVYECVVGRRPYGTDAAASLLTARGRKLVSLAEQISRAPTPPESVARRFGELSGLPVRELVNLTQIQPLEEEDRADLEAALREGMAALGIDAKVLAPELSGYLQRKLADVLAPDPSARNPDARDLRSACRSVRQTIAEAPRTRRASAPPLQQGRSVTAGWDKGRLKQALEPAAPTPPASVAPPPGSLAGSGATVLPRWAAGGLEPARKEQPPSQPPSPAPPQAPPHTVSFSSVPPAAPEAGTRPPAETPQPSPSQEPAAPSQALTVPSETALEDSSPLDMWRPASSPGVAALTAAAPLALLAALLIPDASRYRLIETVSYGGWPLWALAGLTLLQVIGAVVVFRRVADDRETPDPWPTVVTAVALAVGLVGCLSGLSLAREAVAHASAELKGTLMAAGSAVALGSSFLASVLAAGWSLAQGAAAALGGRSRAAQDRGPAWPSAPLLVAGVFPLALLLQDTSAPQPAGVTLALGCGVGGALTAWLSRGLGEREPSQRRFALGSAALAGVLAACALLIEVRITELEVLARASSETLETFYAGARSRTAWVKLLAPIAAALSAAAALGATRGGPSLQRRWVAAVLTALLASLGVTALATRQADAANTSYTALLRGEGTYPESRKLGIELPVTSSLRTPPMGNLAAQGDLEDEYGFVSLGDRMVSVAVSQQEIVVDGVPVLSMISPHGQEGSAIPQAEKRGMLVSRLFDNLYEKADNAKTIAEYSADIKYAFSGDVLLLFDKTLPFSVVREVLYTAAQAQFGQFHLAALGEQGEPRVVHTALPAIAPPGKEQLNALNLTVSISEEGLTLLGADAVLYADGAPHSEVATLPCSAGGRCEGRLDRYDLVGLRRLLGLIKDEYPDEEEVIIVPSSDTSYEVIIAVMDAAREDPEVRVAGDPRSLFPYPILAGGAM